MIHKTELCRCGNQIVTLKELYLGWNKIIEKMNELILEDKIKLSDGTLKIDNGYHKVSQCTEIGIQLKGYNNQFYKYEDWYTIWHNSFHGYLRCFNCSVKEMEFTPSVFRYSMMFDDSNEVARKSLSGIWKDFKIHLNRYHVAFWEDLFKELSLEDQKKWEEYSTKHREETEKAQREEDKRHAGNQFDETDEDYNVWWNNM